MFVPAANIVVSYDPEAMIAFQASKDFGSFKKFVDSQDGRKRETLIFSNAPNSNFLSLSHELGGDGDNKIKLTCVPTLMNWSNPAIRLDDSQSSQEDLVRELLLEDN